MPWKSPVFLAEAVEGWLTAMPYRSNSCASPRNRKNPMLSVMKVSMTLAPWAGIPAGSMQNQWHGNAGDGSDDQVQEHSRHHDRPRAASR